MPVGPVEDAQQEPPASAANSPYRCFSFVALTLCPVRTPEEPTLVHRPGCPRMRGQPLAVLSRSSVMVRTELRFRSIMLYVKDPAIVVLSLFKNSKSDVLRVGLKRTTSDSVIVFAACPDKLQSASRCKSGRGRDQATPVADGQCEEKSHR